MLLPLVLKYSCFNGSPFRDTDSPTNPSIPVTAVYINDIELRGGPCCWILGAEKTGRKCLQVEKPSSLWELILRLWSESIQENSLTKVEHTDDSFHMQDGALWVFNRIRENREVFSANVTFWTARMGCYISVVCLFGDLCQYWPVMWIYPFFISNQVQIMPQQKFKLFVNIHIILSHASDSFIQDCYYGVTLIQGFTTLKKSG